ncbi:MAG: UDP-N-acetylmuramoyl-L-alanine--D-glutamate ligase [Nitrospinae bacterium]|nr:UDP-N-acetylmuramoyl-L-alanine--D-glutamate ligase [Nitrospinota bacterium]MBL7020256.1 UDP-N-acetylmuramoyl-L-alanine--D-glutamate ligase [Nitrospinaceae bacterium]
MELKNKNLSVVGLGQTGVAVANFLSRQGACVTVTDGKPREQLLEPLKQLCADVKIRFQNPEPPSDAEGVVLSPGVDIHSPFLEDASRKGIEIISEIELANRFNIVPIIAITGTNGKSTCTSLTAEIFAQAGKTVQAGGNLGTPFISLLDQGDPDYRILEISSFQMEATSGLHPVVAVILNISPDHMDRHKDFQTYVELKKKIFARQTRNNFLVLNQDDPNTRDLGKDCPAERILFSTQVELEKGIFLRGNKIIARLKNSEMEVLSLESLSRGMQWQVENILPAIAVALLLNVPQDAIERALQNFTSLEHRLEWVRSLNGVDFVNDSKGTNVGSVCKSLNTFDRPIILIIGGKDKDTDFSPLKNLMKEKVKHLILIGETRNKFKEILNGSFGYEESDSMEEAVGLARAKAGDGDIVLLSPACSSFDMFKDYADRGTRFKTIVKNLEG